MIQASNDNLGCSSLNVSSVSLSKISIQKQSLLSIGYFISSKMLKATSSSYTRRVNFLYWTSINVLLVAKKGLPKISGTSLSSFMSRIMNL